MTAALSAAALGISMIQEEQIKLRARDGVESDAALCYESAAARGVGVLGGANRYSSREAELILENTVLDWAAGVDYLHQAGYRKVIGIGNSGGGEIAVCYHSESVHATIRGTPLGDPPDLTKMK